MKPNVPLLNVAIFHVDSKQLTNLSFYLFSNNNKKQRNCLCVHFSSTLETLFCGLERNVLEARAPSFHPSERYLWWFTPGLPQEMLTTWNKIPPLPRAINKPEIYESFSLQRWGGKTSLEHNKYFIYGLQEGNKSTQGQRTSKWKRAYKEDI